MKKTLEAVLNAYGATGRETTVAAVIREMVEPYVDEIRTDALGNLICVRKGEGKRVMLASHMDHIGYMVMDIDEKGFLRVASVGGVNPMNSANRRVVFENGLTGVVSREVRDVKAEDVTMDNIFIDIGAADAEEAGRLVRIGDVAVYQPDVAYMANDLISAPALDDRCCCAIVIETLKALKTRNNEVCAVFTVQEEIGTKGAQAAAYELDPDMAVALDVTMAGDSPKGPRISVKLGKGPCVKIKDSGVVCSPEVVEKMEAAAERAGVAWQREVLVGGATDARPIQISRSGVPVGVLSVPCRYIHSPCETASMRDMEDGVKLMVELLDGEL